MDKKALIREFYEVVFNQHDIEAVPRYMREDYIQHNPGLAHGRQAFMDGFRQKFIDDPDFRLEIRMMAEDEDWVWVYLKKKSPEGQTQARVIDMYRIQDGMLAEHYDVLQKV